MHILYSDAQYHVGNYESNWSGLRFLTRLGYIEIYK